MWGAMNHQLLLLGGFAALLAGALASWLIGERRAGLLRYIGLAAVAAAGASFTSVSVSVLRSGAALGPITLWHPSLVRASVSIRVDALSAFFLLLISGLS